MSQSVSPKVSISIITYNHAAYIRQTLEGILMQQTDFEYEVIIGDDLSPDNTREILLEYQAKHPDKISLILHEEKAGGIPGKMNFVSTIHAAKGEYIALLDGDDFWTDPLKLQRQVDFLDQNQEHSLCFHNAQIVFEGVEGNERPYNPWTTPQTFQIDDLILNEWFIHSGSIMYRRKWFPRVKDSFYALPSGDIPIGITLADQGPVGYLPYKMSVYRKNPGSASHQAAHKAIQASKARIQIFEALNGDLENRHAGTFQKAIQRKELEIAKFALRSGEQSELRQQIKVLKSNKASFSGKQQQLFRILSLFEKFPFLQPLVPMILRVRSKLSSTYHFE